MTRDTLLQGNEIINVFTEALRDDLVSTVTKLRAGLSKNRGSISRKDKGFFRCSKMSISHLVLMSAEQRLPLRRETYHSPVSSAKLYLHSPHMLSCRAKGQISVGFTDSVQRKLLLHRQITSTASRSITQSHRRSLRVIQELSCIIRNHNGVIFTFHCFSQCIVPAPTQEGHNVPLSTAWFRI
jgi:hypothetical protein